LKAFFEEKEKKRASDIIQYMCEKIAKQQYNINLPDDEPFYLNVREDSESKSGWQQATTCKCHDHI